MPEITQQIITEETRLSTSELREVWPLLLENERLEAFRGIPEAEAEEFFFSLDTPDQTQLLLALPDGERRAWMRSLAPDDASDVIQEAPEEQREHLLSLLDDKGRKEVTELMAYPEDEAGGIMNPRYAALKPDTTVDQAIAFLRKQASEAIETIYYSYVLDAGQKLLGVVSFRDLFTAPGAKKVREIMTEDMVIANDDMDQEALSRLFATHDLKAIPVVDAQGRMKGIVSVDDIIDVMQEEGTEDIHKIGGSEALDAPYLETTFLGMVRKRAPWLAILFLGEMLTTTAMAYYDKEIERAVVLALFIPLIISSGGNSGSQASTLVIRAMALGEVRLRDWWRIFRREAGTGLLLGAILGIIALARIWFWPTSARVYGEHYIAVGVTVACSLVGVVLWGTITGSMLPILLRRIGLDPASASAPFVATLADVTGLVIYFSLASIILSGLLL